MIIIVILVRFPLLSVNDILSILLNIRSKLLHRVKGFARPGECIVGCLQATLEKFDCVLSRGEVVNFELLLLLLSVLGRKKQEKEG